MIKKLKPREKSRMKAYKVKRQFMSDHNCDYMEQDIIFIPPDSIIAKHPTKEDKFFYISKGRVLEDVIREIGNSKSQTAVDIDANKIKDLMIAANNYENAKKEFCRKAKSLFELVKEYNTKKSASGGRAN